MTTYQIYGVNSINNHHYAIETVNVHMGRIDPVGKRNNPVDWSGLNGEGILSFSTTSYVNPKKLAPLLAKNGLVLKVLE